jgi:hypothetical protein
MDGKLPLDSLPSSTKAHDVATRTAYPGDAANRRLAYGFTFDD